MNPEVPAAWSHERVGDQVPAIGTDVSQVSREPVFFILWIVVLETAERSIIGMHVQEADFLKIVIKERYDSGIPGNFGFFHLLLQCHGILSACE